MKNNLMEQMAKDRRLDSRREIILSENVNEPGTHMSTTTELPLDTDEEDK